MEREEIQARISALVEKIIATVFADIGENPGPPEISLGVTAVLGVLSTLISVSPEPFALAQFCGEELQRLSAEGAVKVMEEMKKRKKVIQL